LQAAGEEPGTGRLHLFVEHIDIADHIFALLGPVVAVGVMNRNQILRHNFSFSCDCLRAGHLPAFTMTTNNPTRIRQTVGENFSAKQRGSSGFRTNDPAEI
jgi:hypothetical protein